MGIKMAQISKIPNFIVKSGRQKPPQIRGGFSCISGFFFLNFFVFFSLFLLISCGFMTSWNPKTAHQVRLQAYIYIYIYIVSLVVILRNWVCNIWVYQCPRKATQNVSSAAKKFLTGTFLEFSRPIKRNLENSTKPESRDMATQTSHSGFFEM